jgi:hypothetical protein
MQLHRPIHQKQSGYSALEVLLIVLVVAVLAVIGLVVYQLHKPSSTKNSAATSQTQTSTQPNNTTTMQTQQTTTQYLTITEWGVKLPLSSAISDAYYVVSTSTRPDANGPVQMLLGFKSLDSSGCTASSNTDTAPILLFRVPPTEKDAVTGQVISQSYPGVTIGNYFYGYALNKNGVCKADFDTLKSEMTTAVQGIVPASN